MPPLRDSMVCRKRNRENFPVIRYIISGAEKKKKKAREHRWIWAVMHTWSTLISQIQRFQYCQFSLVSSKNHNDYICDCSWACVLPVITIQVHKHKSSSTGDKQILSGQTTFSYISDQSWGGRGSESTPVMWVHKEKQGHGLLCNWWEYKTFSTAAKTPAEEWNIHGAQSVYLLPPNKQGLLQGSSDFNYLKAAFL